MCLESLPRMNYGLLKRDLAYDVDEGAIDTQLEIEMPVEFSDSGIDNLHPDG